MFRAACPDPGALLCPVLAWSLSRREPAGAGSEWYSTSTLEGQLVAKYRSDPEAVSRPPAAALVRANERSAGSAMRRATACLTGRLQIQPCRIVSDALRCAARASRLSRASQSSMTTTRPTKNDLRRLQIQSSPDGGAPRPTWTWRSSPIQPNPTTHRGSGALPGRPRSVVWRVGCGGATQTTPSRPPNPDEPRVQSEEPPRRRGVSGS